MNNFFDEHSPYLAHPLLTDERTASEVDRLTALIGLEPDHRLLDIGCAFGRHSIAFAARGLDVTGVDPSPAMLDVARGRAVGVDVAFVSSIDQADGPFDAAIAMFTTLGQVDAGGETNEAIVGRARAALRPGGSLVVEVPQRGVAIAGLIEADRFEVGAVTTTIERTYRPESSRVVERFVVTDSAAEPPVERIFDLSYRLFDAEELVALLEESGFVDVRIAGSLDGLIAGSRLVDTDPTMVVIAATPS